jgi:DNA-binding NarL/FixJ family response regulator
VRNIIIGSGLLITLLIILFKLGETQLIKGNVRLEVIIAITSVIFFIAGIYFNRKKEKTETSPESVNQEPQLFIDKKFLQKPPTDPYGLSKREMEVLQKMGAGLSNQEIATALFLSESTIKTHVSNILFKLEAKRRTEAINIARERGII